MVFFPENCYFRRPAPGPRCSTVPLYRRSKVFAISKCAKFHFSLRPAAIHPAARRRFPPFVPANSTFCLYRCTFYPPVFYSAKPFHAGCSCMNCIFCCSLLQNSKGGAKPRLCSACQKSLSLRGAQRRGNPLPFWEGRIPAPVRAGGQSRPPLQTRNDRSKAAGHMDPTLQGRCVEPPVGDGVPTSRQRGSDALSLRGAKRRGNPYLFRQEPAKSAEFVRFRNGLPRQCAHWLAMTDFFDSLRRGGAKPRLCSLLHSQQLRRSSSHTSS